MRLYAAILREDTWQPSTKALNGLGKAKADFDRIEKYVDQAWTQITNMRQAHPVVDWQAVFLAPEYFFSNRRESNDRFFSHDVKRTIVQNLAALAKKYPKLLIVPGTVLWTKEQNKGTPEDIRKRKDKMEWRSLFAEVFFGTNTKSKGWAYSGNPKGKNVRIAQNIAYVCLGDQIVKYAKVGNYKEVEGEKGDIVFSPGNIVGRFSVGGVKYALEICMDHALGALDSTSFMGAVHVHLIVSSYVGFNQRNSAAVTLHSSTESSAIKVATDQGYGKAGEAPGTTKQLIVPRTQQVRFIEGGGARVAAGFKNNPVKIGPLTIWAIDLDNQKLNITNAGDYTIKDTALPSVSDKYLV